MLFSKIVSDLRFDALALTGGVALGHLPDGGADVPAWRPEESSLINGPTARRTPIVNSA